jgi:hypothetical protein
MSDSPRVGRAGLLEALNDDGRLPAPITGVAGVEFLFVSSGAPRLSSTQ